MSDLATIILASSSIYRKQQLESLGIDFLTVAPDIDESPKDFEPATDLVLRLAMDKSLKVQSLHPDACIIGSDQVCISGGQIFGKPGTAVKAIKQLQSFSNNRVEFFTALCVLVPSGEKLSHMDKTVIEFRQLSTAEIQRYIEKDQPLNCAGAFKVESLGLSLFKSVTSEDPSALIGLPLISLSAFLRQIGYQVP